MSANSQAPNLDGAVEVTNCETVSDFVAAISPRAARFNSAYPRAWVYRGHSNDGYLLIPTALRNNSEALSDLTLFSITNNKDQVWNERKVLTDFLEISDSIGLPIPEDSQLLRQWLASDIGNVKIWPPNEVLSLMALAQHHGLPTRLLDWSRHPMKAALFAAFEAYEKSDKSGRLSVWALSFEKLSMLSSDQKPFIVVTAPSASNQNLRAQEGIFTLAKHIIPDQADVDRAPFDAILQEWVHLHEIRSPGPWLHRITLPQTLAGELCLELALEGITRSSLFPDFYGVVNAMKDHVKLFNGKDSPGGRRASTYLDTFVMSRKVSIPISEIFPNTNTQ